MPDWGSGYVTDVEYTEAFYPAQTPQLLTLTAIINGYEPPDVADGFSYCELGCGKGMTTLMLAAANPNATFHAVDFNPAHIAHARSRARAAQLSNTHWHERSFSDLAGTGGDDLPMFDFITMHGVWTWVSPELQNAIVQFMDRHLKPGGLVFVSYNGMPAWNFMGPIQRLLRELAGTSALRSDHSIDSAITMLARLAEAKIIPPEFDKAVKRLTESTHRRNLTYLAHEYLNEHWQPAYHADVARAFAGAKLAYIGTTDLLRNFSNLTLSESHRALLDEIPSPELRETLKDFCLDHWFHQDVYVRGARRTMEDRRDAMLSSLRLALIRPIPKRIEIAGPEETVWRPSAEAYGPFMDALERGPHKVSELVSLPGVPASYKRKSLEVVGVLVGTGIAAPYTEPQADATAGCDRLNHLIEAEGEVALTQTATIAAASVGLGMPMPAALFDLYLALRRGEKPDPQQFARRFVRRCREEGGHPIIDGKSYEDETEALTAVERDYAAKIAHVVPIWKNLGMV
ncbi:MAG TPA: class I SAM-dependent methyltransferase [Micropepsaceae bacterium]|jgi:SAM-dependent methyltransferase|nr:class I SAM-dependent methyltransferase [Micropepsaceae bacterium]